MLAEKSVIFIHPFNKAWMKVLQALDEDDEYSVYEVDSAAEYAQIVSILEASVTVSAQSAKLLSCLEQDHAQVNSEHSYIFLSAHRPPPLKELSLLKKKGLRDVMPEVVTKDDFVTKLEDCFGRIEQALQKEADKKQREEELQQKLAQARQKSKQEKSKPEKLRIERMATDPSDEEKGTLHKKQTHGFSFDAPNFEDKKKKSHILDLPNDPHYKRKDITSLDLENPSWAQNKKFHHFDEELERKKQKRLNLPDAIGKKNTAPRFEEHEQDDHDRKKVDLPEIFGKKKERKIFEEVERDSPERRKLDLDGNDFNRKESDKFEEAQRDAPERKKLDLNESDLDRKKGEKFEEVEREGLSPENNKDKHEENRELKNNKFEEVPRELNRQKNIDFADIEKSGEHKRADLSTNDEQKHKGRLDLVDLEQKTKNHPQFEEAQRAVKKHERFEDVQRDQKDRKHFEEYQEEKKPLKKLSLEEEKTNENVLSKFEEMDLSKKNKKGNFIEVGLERERTQSELQQKDKGIYEEIVLDYSFFKKRYQEMQQYPGKDSALEEGASRPSEEDLLALEDRTYYIPRAYDIDAFVYIQNLLAKREDIRTKLFAFVNFMLFKKFSGVLTIYEYDASKAKAIYRGHEVLKQIEQEQLFLELEKLSFSSWVDLKLPTWMDSTFQEVNNQFLYPFVHDGEFYAFALVHFDKANDTLNNENASHIESLIMCLRCCFGTGL